MRCDEQGSSKEMSDYVMGKKNVQPASALEKSSNGGTGNISSWVSSAMNLSFLNSSVDHDTTFTTTESESSSPLESSPDKSLSLPDSVSGSSFRSSDKLLSKTSLFSDEKFTLSETSSSSVTCGSSQEDNSGSLYLRASTRLPVLVGSEQSLEAPDNDSRESEISRISPYPNQAGHEMQLNASFSHLPTEKLRASMMQRAPSFHQLRSRHSISSRSDRLRHSASNMGLQLDEDFDDLSDMDEPEYSPRDRRSSKKVQRKHRRRRFSRQSSSFSTHESSSRESSKKTSSRGSGVRVFLWIVLVSGLVSVSVTFIAGHSMLAAKELEDLENPKNMAVLYRLLDAVDDGTENDMENGGGDDKTLNSEARLGSRSAGLRGIILHDMVVQMEQQKPKQNKRKDSNKHQQVDKKEKEHRYEKDTRKETHEGTRKENVDAGRDKVSHHKQKKGDAKHNHESHRTPNPFNMHFSPRGGMAFPHGKLSSTAPQFDAVDASLYRYSTVSNDKTLRVVSISEDVPPTKPRTVELYPSPFTDNTQLYPVLDSSDEKAQTMELRPRLSDDECVPMQRWQETFHPSCNAMHEIGMGSIGHDSDTDFTLFGTKGYWRNAWRVDSVGGQEIEQPDTVVLKTLKIEHRFEEKHYEHDRVDAVAMERLTASPHVINIFSYCGQSVMTEFADGKRLGHLADKARKTPLERLRIARDIATGIADVHGIDGEGNATLVHLDINPANVVTVKGTLKINDFNIGILRRWNTTSNTPCGFPAQYPNPQWRSPEEARNEQHLTEKVDVYSMGHIFFRLICGHEPWHKLEIGGVRPSKEELTDKIVGGNLPFIPKEVTESVDPEEVAIREAMLKCYTYDPAKRPSAREIASTLQSALDHLQSS